MKRTIIKDVNIVNEGEKYIGTVVVCNDTIEEVFRQGEEYSLSNFADADVIDGKGLFLIPGVIDDHVHFREPGLTHKANIRSESMAAVSGGITTIMDMPNTTPQTTTVANLNDKFEIMSRSCLANYSCYFGATNSNYGMLKDLDKKTVCGVKIYMGSSTGDMLVDRRLSLQNIFGGTDLIIAAHCEDQTTISNNTARYKEMYGDNVDVKYHPKIRSAEACYLSSKFAIELANEANARLHIMHISTAKELSLFSSGQIDGKRITAEACTPHIWFDDSAYQTLGGRVKCNPAVKTAEDKEAIRRAINSDVIDIIATDHAPHLLSEKQGGALKAASGIPVIQYSLISMLQLVSEGVFSIEKVVEKMCHAPAKLFSISKRGFIRKGYKADLVLLNANDSWKATDDSTLSLCKWTPFDNCTFNWKVKKTFVNGNCVYDGIEVYTAKMGEQLLFDR